MSNKKIERVKKDIETAIKRQRMGRHIEISEGSWGVRYNTETNKWQLQYPDYGGCCPMAAVILDKQPQPTAKQIREHLESSWPFSTIEFDETYLEKLAAFSLGIKSVSVGQFVCGFDGLEETHPAGARPASPYYRLGQEFNRKYI